MKKLRFLLLVPALFLLALLPTVKVRAFYYEMEYREYQTEKTLKAMDSGGLKEGPEVIFQTGMTDWVYAYSEITYSSGSKTWSEIVYAEDSYMDKLILDLTDFKGQISIVAYYSKIKVPYSLKLHDLSGDENALMEPETVGFLEDYDLVWSLPHFDGYEMEHVEYHIYYDGSYTRRVNLPRNVIGYKFTTPGLFYNATELEMNVYYYPLGINYTASFTSPDGPKDKGGVIAEAVSGTMDREDQQIAIPKVSGYALDHVVMSYKNAEGEAEKQTIPAENVKDGVLRTTIGAGIYGASFECVYVQDEIQYTMSYFNTTPAPGAEASMKKEDSGSVKRSAIEFKVPEFQDFVLKGIEAVISYNDGSPDETVSYEAAAALSGKLTPALDKVVSSIAFKCLYQPTKIPYTFLYECLEGDVVKLKEESGSVDRKAPAFSVLSFADYELIEIKVSVKTGEEEKVTNYASLAVENGKFKPVIAEDANSVALTASFKKIEKPTEAPTEATEATEPETKATQPASSEAAPTESSKAAAESSTAAAESTPAETKTGGKDKDKDEGSKFALGDTVKGILIGAGSVFVLGGFGFILGRANARKRRKRRNRIRNDK